VIANFFRDLLHRLTGNRRRIDPHAWDELCRQLPLLVRYSPADRERLRVLAEEFLCEKSIEGQGGLQLSEPMQLLIAAQACVPVLNLGLDWYDGWVSVLVYPDTFVTNHEYRDGAGVVHRRPRELIGESWQRGPVVLSWQHVAGRYDEGNVVVHEFAHKLDLQNGVANGMPPLHANMQRQAWTDVMSAAFDDLHRRLDEGRFLPVDEYAAEDPGEFFAVVSEVFFLQPGHVHAAWPGVYDQLCLFYRQDPLGIIV